MFIQGAGDLLIMSRKLKKGEESIRKQPIVSQAMPLHTYLHLTEKAVFVKYFPLHYQ
jgi:hypothetical protein